RTISRPIRTCTTAPCGRTRHQCLAASAWRTTSCCLRPRRWMCSSLRATRSTRNGTRCSACDAMASTAVGRDAHLELAGSRARIRIMETVAMATIVAMVAGLVLYPMYYLFQAALDVGLPDTRPPTAYGLANFAKLLDYPTVLWNTFVVTCVATLLALLFGFISAWILTRTNVPFRRTLDQLMTVPYY